MPKDFIAWPHAPTHHLSEAGTFLVTAGTYRKEHYFRGSERLATLQRGLLILAHEYEWDLEAWCVFSNHYHFVGHCPAESGAASLSNMLGDLHQKLSAWVNRLDGRPGRKVWHNYWETRLTYQSSYLARLNYVHQNAVKHGLVAVANQYPWCSAGWFEVHATPAQVKTVYGFKTDQLAILDDYDPALEW